MKRWISELVRSRSFGNKNLRHNVTRVGILVLLYLVVGRAHAQTLTTLCSFNGSNGNGPNAGVTLVGSTLYGTTATGGATWSGGTSGDGAVFSIATSGGNPTTLCSFNGSNGEWPEAGLTFVGSTLYGTAAVGGANNEGTVFSIATSGGSPTTLCTFNGGNGAWPLAGFTLNGSTLYGTTANGGNGDGTVFSIATSGGSLKTLCSFNSSSGETPFAGLTVNGSTLYGTTRYGGADGDGTVFSIATSGGSPTTLCSFNSSNGQYAQASLTLNGSTLYGTTYYGGGNGDGTVFSIATSGGSPTTLCSFNGNNGANPAAGLTLVGSTLFGTTSGGGANGDGTLFSIPTSGGNPRILCSFNGSNGSDPLAGVTLNGSTLYGTTCGGGANGNGTVFALNIAPATIALANPQNTAIITGGSGTVGMIVSNSSSAGLNLNYTLAAAVVSGSATLGTITSGTGSLVPSASQSCTVSATSTNLGSNTIAFTASDPNSSNLSQTATATLTVLGHAAPSLSVAGGNDQTVIIGATGITAALSLSNGAWGQSALASLDVNSLGSGVSGPTGGALVPSGSAQAYTAVFNTGAVGLQTQTLSLNVGDDHTLPGASPPLNVSASATLTVLDHSNASLSSSAAQTTQTINFGNVLRGATIPSQSFTIYNLAANTSAAYTANLKLTGFSNSGDPALSTNLSTFNGLTANSGSNGNTFTASLNTSNYTTTGINTVTMSAAQLADDSSLPGAGNNNNGAVMVTLQGNVGNATADNSNSQTAFGQALTAPVAVNGSYANLESTVSATSGSGGQGMAGSTATIVAGTNSSGSAQTVSMAWRTQTQGEIGSGVIGDIVQLSGMDMNGSGGQTAPFVLQMSYDSDVLPGTSAADDPLYLAWLDPTTGLWENAVNGNIGTTSGNFEVGAYPNGDTTVGDWGVNTANQTVWAVVNHDGEFAVVPEPGTLTLLGVVAVGLLSYRMRLRRRRAARTSVSLENGTQATLSFSPRQPQATRRAA